MYKNITLLHVISIIIIIILTACSTVDPGVYGERRSAIIERERAAQERAISAQEDAKMARERAQARNAVALDEIKNVNKTPVIGPNGVKGGFPVIFINDARYGRTIMIQKIDGINAGYRWSLSIPASRFREYNLETGTYKISWTIEGDYNQRQNGSVFEVTENAKFYYDATKKQYCGGYRFFGR